MCTRVQLLISRLVENESCCLTSKVAAFMNIHLSYYELLQYVPTTGEYTSGQLITGSVTSEELGENATYM